MSAVLLERPTASIGLLRLNRPEVRNAIDDTVRALLVDHLAALDADPDIRCVIVTGGEKVFAAGADIKAMSVMSAADMAASPAAAAYAAIRAFRKPVIAAVCGFALGGGCELAMHADIIVAGEGAKFGQPEIKVGIMPGAGGTQRLPRAVGKFKAMKLLLTGDFISAREADGLGLVSEVVPDAEVLPRALALATAIAGLPPIAAREIKRAVLEGADLPLADGLALERRAFVQLFDTKDQKEGMMAFLEKRPADFKGE
ncbi:enoyl-CoA hydratase-related protein [Chelatococcus asaccharovorans]|uniref:Short chain enoyl-CoA hydratase n=1 Tax=Chelatococcus asaccharovorans TaxID=28210 RepID=A0A2V3UI34_9HYPH|nr:enoyl-CoA hydratase-related protein [Chelatococcus asaccharovorans]MBS7701815.1 enoyl-CoA hydratase/isomerase family protein [Chelatococcus asaccharovorans]PXW64477.1 short chain enoyl-CoA hydratase [Chelatococcus asaccharovorans]